jgi:hypothetical protein
MGSVIGHGQKLRLGDAERISLCEALDRVLNKGVVIRGDITISVAQVELIYLGLNLLVASTEALRRVGSDLATEGSVRDEQ